VSHDPSDIILLCWFGAQETFLIINVENNASMFLGLSFAFDQFIWIGFTIFL